MHSKFSILHSAFRNLLFRYSKVVFPTLLAAASLALACAVLSVPIVLRRWAFIGEGIAHAGFGGVGTAWLLALLFPSLSHPTSAYAISIAFCVAAGIGIAALTRSGKLNADTAIGIFLAASLAWGFLAQSIYTAQKHMPPPDFESFLIGSMQGLSLDYALIAVAVALAVVVTVFALFKEILAYCFDPALAEVSGIRVSFIHYLLILLITITIVVAMRLMGQLLVTALLVLPGAAALQWTRQLKNVFLGAGTIAILAAIAGPLLHARWSFIPPGPAIALLLLLEFLFLYAIRKVPNHNSL